MRTHTRIRKSEKEREEEERVRCAELRIFVRRNIAVVWLMMMVA